MPKTGVLQARHLPRRNCDWSAMLGSDCDIGIPWKEAIDMYIQQYSDILRNKMVGWYAFVEIPSPMVDSSVAYVMHTSAHRGPAASRSRT